MPWQKLVARPQTLLTGDFVLSGIRNGMKMLMGADLDVRFEIENKVGAVYESVESRKLLNKLFTKKVAKDKSLLERHLKEGKESYVNLLEISKNVGKQTENTQKNITVLFEKYKKAFFKFIPFLHSVFSAEKYLTDELNSLIEKNLKIPKEEAFRILTTTQTSSDFYEGQVNLLTIAIEKRSGKEYKDLLEIHTQKFSYMGLTNSFESEPYNTSYFETLITEIENPTHELEMLQKGRLKELNRYKDFVKNLPKEIVVVAEVLQKYMLFRNDRIIGLKLSQHNVKPLLNIICENTGTSFNDLIWYKVFELENLIQNSKKVDTDEISKRKIYVDAQLVDGNLTYTTKKQGTNKQKEETVITGSVASVGKARGIVRIVPTAKDIGKVKMGEILVTSMTTPDFVPAMRKAAAIVTDEGGILSHAAIVSREMGIPCVIGTKIATKVLKTGDFVNVDAEKGVITVLKRYSGS
jgi:phosphoenolpyruvate synthase/pyruvate phosphate dikinase